MTLPAPSGYQPAVNPTVARLLLPCYAILFAGIIYIANHGGGSLWHFLTDLPFGDKLGHVALVGTLSLLLNLALKGRRGPGKLSGVMLGSLLVAILMTLEEASQAFFPSRSLDLLDGIANLLGVAAGEALARLLLRPKRTPSPAI